MELAKIFDVLRAITRPFLGVMAWNDTFSAFQTELYHYRTKTQFPKFWPIIQLANCGPISDLRAKLSERKLCPIPRRTITATQIRPSCLIAAATGLWKKSDTKKAHLIVLAQIFDLQRAITRPFLGVMASNDTFSAFQTQLYHYRTKTQFPKFWPIIQLANWGPN